MCVWNIIRFYGSSGGQHPNGEPVRSSICRKSSTTNTRTRHSFVLLCMVGLSNFRCRELRSLYCCTDCTRLFMRCTACTIFSICNRPRCIKLTTCCTVNVVTSICSVPLGCLRIPCLGVFFAFMFAVECSQEAWRDSFRAMWDETCTWPSW